MTSYIERIKILEGRISKVVDYVNTILSENEKLKTHVKELKTAKKEIEIEAEKAFKLDENLKKYEKEREVIKNKIDSIINQIDQLEI